MTMTKPPQILMTTMTMLVKYFFAFYGDIKSGCITIKQQDEEEVEVVFIVLALP